MPAAGIPLYVTAVQARTRRESQLQACIRIGSGLKICRHRGRRRAATRATSAANAEPRFGASSWSQALPANDIRCLAAFFWPALQTSLHHLGQRRFARPPRSCDSDSERGTRRRIV